MDELLKLQDEANTRLLMLAERRVGHTCDELVQIWNAINLLAGHIIMLREGSDAGI